MKTEGRCSICTLADGRPEIDRAILLGQVSLTAIAKTYELSRSSLIRHANRHVLKELSKTKRATTKAALLVALDEQVDSTEPVVFDSAKSVLDQLQNLYNHQMQLFTRAKQTDDVRLMSRALDGGSAVLEKLGKAWNLFQSDGAVTINLTQSVNERRLEKMISNMDEQQMRNYLTGNKSPEMLAIQQQHERDVIEHRQTYNPDPLHNVTRTEDEAMLDDPD